MHSFFVRTNVRWVAHPIAWIGEWVGAPVWTRLQGWSACTYSNYLKPMAPNIPTLYI
jgi:hypothetical protein